MVLEIEGDDLSKLENESGGHRIQQVSPTEKRGRIHTSTITVAVLDENVGVSDLYKMRSEEDFRIEFFSGTGKGGSNRNKVKACCRITHLPTGIIKTAQTRSRVNSQRSAMDEMLKHLDSLIFSELNDKKDSIKKQLVGSGMRGDKIRTYREQDDSVHDHHTEKVVRFSKVMKGNFDLLW
jgi:peptide chain release factor 1